MASVLRIGPRVPQEGSTEQSLCVASRLRSAILSHFAESNGAHPSDDGSNVMAISNKYFSAEVAVEFLSDDVRGGSLGNEDGIVLVFDAQGDPFSSECPSDPRRSFDSLTSVHDFAVASDQAGDLIRLCVGVSLSGPVPPPIDKASEEEYSRRVLWCLDRGYEYVEADVSEDGVKAGHDERDKDGFARVVEAVGGTVWSNATMKPRKAAQLRKNFDESEKGLRNLPSRAPAEVSLANGVREGSDEKKECLPRPQESSSSKDGSIFTEGGIKDTDFKKRAEEVLRVDPPEFLDDDEPGDKSIFNDFDDVLQQAAAVRAASKSGELSDEERRKRAGDVATMLAGLMGNMDFDDSDEDEERRIARSE